MTSGRREATRKRRRRRGKPRKNNTSQQENKNYNKKKKKKNKKNKKKKKKKKKKRVAPFIKSRDPHLASGEQSVSIDQIAQSRPKTPSFFSTVGMLLCEPPTSFGSSKPNMM